VLWATLDRHGLTLRGPAAHRFGGDGQLVAVADGHAACGLIEAVVSDAASLRGAKPG
jgi:hypothetical protein